MQIEHGPCRERSVPAAGHGLLDTKVWAAQVMANFPTLSEIMIEGQHLTPTRSNLFSSQPFQRITGRYDMPYEIHMSVVEQPTLFEVERSPLLLKAKCFAQMLKEDNDRIQTFIEEGGDLNEISVDTLDDNEPEHIEIHLMKIKTSAEPPEHHEFAPPDDTELPADGWRPATE
jgi:hypothetical protein